MRRFKKYQSGEATQYITRRSAIRKLQLSLKDFRRLCILKGVYPREPKNRRRAQKGSTDIKILYHAKDIQFLLHEPIVWTLRDYKIFAKKTGRDRAIKDFRNMKRRLDQFPELKLDHIVKERYPTFVDAIKDLDDCLTLLFLFSTFPSLKYIPREQSSLCRRLTVEFLQYVITSKSLRKVFISIKGYYFQADIKGQKVTWIIPHYYPFKPLSKEEVDFKVMSIFVEFYTIMLGFINYRLYHSINLSYPPQFPVRTDTSESLKDDTSYVSARVANLNYDLKCVDIEQDLEEHQEINIDEIQQETNSKQIVQIKREVQEVELLRVLFKGLKFFINREVPREPLVLIIRSFGGIVSWDSTIFTGGKFDESDETITHQIIDRPNKNKRYISRDYVQPQWVFDCVNQGKLLPTNIYFMGIVLPPHLSPFVNPGRLSYTPPEEKTLNSSCLIKMDAKQHPNNNEAINTQTLTTFQEEKSEIQCVLHGSNEEGMKNIEINGGSEINLDAKTEMDRKANMIVCSGQLHKADKRQLHKNKVDEHRLQARMVKPRHRKLFRKLIHDKQLREKEDWLLHKKRRIIDTQNKT